MRSWGNRAFWVVLLLVAALAVGGVIYGLLRHGVPARREAPEFLPQGQDLGLSEVRQTAMKEGRLQWELFARSAGFIQKENQAFMDEVRVDFHGKDGRIVHVSAARGMVDTRNNDVGLTGDVAVVDGTYTLTTESLRYESGKELILSETRSRLLGRGLDVAGDRFAYDLSGGRMDVRGHVEGKIGDEDPKRPR